MTLQRGNWSAYLTVTGILATYVVAGVSLYRWRTGTQAWSSVAHSDFVVFVLPALVASVLLTLVLWRWGGELGGAALVACVTVALAFVVLMILAIGMYGT